MTRSLSLLLVIAACSSTNHGTPDGNTGGDGKNGDGAQGDGRGTDGTQGNGRTIFVIPMENESSTAIYGSANAPYINNTLIPMSAYATMFTDELPALDPSEPHYVWMEAGTNSFSDTTFLTDADADSGNSTNSTEHLVTQLHTAGLEWISYQEGMTTGTCPVKSISGAKYAAKHDPFVFFQDVSGASPSTGNAYCAAHHKPYTSSAFAADLAGGSMPAYVFITPNLCNDMHGATGCPSGSDITTGDTWLSNELPRILTYANAHDSVVYLIWDEGSSNQTIPFLAFGPHIKTGASPTVYTHSSQVKSIEEQLGVPVLSTVTTANDFAGMFQTGYFP